MVMGHRIAERSEAGGEVIELAVVRGDNFTQPGKVGREVVELTVMPRHRTGHLRQQLVDGCDIGTVWTTHAITLAAVTRPGQALRGPRSPDPPCGRAC